MAESEFRVINLKEVVGDFREFDKDTRRGFRNVLNRYGTIIKRSQKQTLKRRVRQNPNYYKKRGQNWRDRWTGKLSGSIGVLRKAWSHLEIGPNVAYKVDYAEFIEGGTPATGKKPYGNPNARDFPGHHYVRDATNLNDMKGRVSKDLREVIKNSQKK